MTNKSGQSVTFGCEFQLEVISTDKQTNQSQYSLAVSSAFLPTWTACVEGCRYVQVLVSAAAESSMKYEFVVVNGPSWEHTQLNPYHET